MRRSLLLPLLAGSVFFNLQGATCSPDAANTTVTATAKKFYCTESLDSSGCNAGRHAVKVTVESTCKADLPVELSCTATYRITSRKFPDGHETTRSTTESLQLKNGRAEDKIYMTLNSLTDPMTDVRIVDTVCSLAGSDAAPASVATVPAAPVPVTPSAEATAPAATVPQTAPAPAALQPAAKTDKELDLEILKEQNRAKELEIKMLELKLRMKETER